MTEGTANGASTRRQRSRFERVVDPFDLAGKAVRLLPEGPTPALAHAVFFVVLGGMTLSELVDPPVALLVAAGHLMVTSHNRYLKELGAAVEEGA